MKKEDWQAAFGQPSASFDARFRQTLDGIDEKEEKNVKHVSVRAIVIALALLMALTGAAYAASQGWRIGDYFGKRGPGSVPDGFESGFSEDYTQEIGEIRFHIRDAYLSGNTLTAMVEVSRKDGQPALFLTDGLDESDPVANFDQALSLETEEKRSIAEYAADEGMPIYRAGSWFTQNGKMTEGAGDEWAENGYRMLVILCQVQNIQGENGAAKLSWDVYTVDAEKGYQEQSLEIELPAEAYKEWTVDVNQTVEGIPVTVDWLTLRQTRMSLEVDIAYHLDEEDMPDPIEENTPASLDYSMIHLADPDTDERLPKGSRIVGFRRWTNDEHTAFDGTLDDVNGVYEKDTLRIKFYDPWQDAYIGFIDVKIK